MMMSHDQVSEKPAEVHDPEQAMVNDGAQAEESLQQPVTPAAEEQDPSVSQATLSALTQEVAYWRDQTLRAVAERENQRQRLSKEIEEAGHYAIAKFAKDMLEVCDNIHRTRQHISEEALASNEALRALTEGLDLVQRAMESAFQRHRLVRVTPQAGDPFDHHQHEAIAHIPHREVAPGCVVSCIRDGYRLYERVLRAAMVSIARAMPEAAPDAAEQPQPPIL